MTDEDLILQRRGARDVRPAEESPYTTIFRDADDGIRPQNRIILAISSDNGETAANLERSTDQKGHAKALNEEDGTAIGEVKNKADGCTVTGVCHDKGKIRVVMPHAYVAVEGTNIKVEVHDEPTPKPEPSGPLCTLL